MRIGDCLKNSNSQSKLVRFREEIRLRLIYDREITPSNRGANVQDYFYKKNLSCLFFEKISKNQTFMIYFQTSHQVFRTMILKS